MKPYPITRNIINVILQLYIELVEVAVCLSGFCFLHGFVYDIIMCLMCDWAGKDQFISFDMKYMIKELVSFVTYVMKVRHEENAVILDRL